MPAKKQINPYIFDGILCVLIASGLINFLAGEPNAILRISVIILLLFSIWRVFKKDNSSLLFIAGFINSTVLFRLVVDGTLPNGIGAIAICLVAIFLFHYRHIRTKHNHTIGGLISTYNSLLGLLIGEVFYVLTFFPIEGKNKAILIVLFLWLYDEVVESYEEGRLSKQFAYTISAIFIIIFAILVLTFPFEVGF